MNSYLLDTHSFLWSIWQPEKLGQQAVAVLENTANIDETDIPEGITLTQNKAGLIDAWQLVKHKTSGEAARFIEREEKELLNHIKTRNNSILAHSFEPVKLSDWQPIHRWLEQQFIPMLLAETSRISIKELPLQLP
jgi:hypothetical protein